MRNQLVDVNRMVRHMKFCTKHGSNEITYIIDSLVQMGPKEVHFIDQNGEKQSICQYFFREYGMQLLDLPLVKTTGKTGKFIPLELCFLKNKEIYHFLSLAKINPTIQRELLLKSTHAPNVYFNKLDEIIKKVASTDPQLQRQFGLSLQSRPVTFQGRVLPTPRQLCRNTQDKFYSAASMPRRWAVFCFDASVELALLKKFVEQMTQRAKFFGLNLGEPNPVAILKIENGKKMRNVFKNLSDLTQAEFVFVGIPRKSNTYPSKWLHFSWFMNTRLISLTSQSQMKLQAYLPARCTTWSSTTVTRQLVSCRSASMLISSPRYPAVTSTTFCSS